MKVSTQAETARQQLEQLRRMIRWQAEADYRAGRLSLGRSSCPGRKKKPNRLTISRRVRLKHRRAA